MINKFVVGALQNQDSWRTAGAYSKRYKQRKGIIAYAAGRIPHLQRHFCVRDGVRLIGNID